MALPCIRYNENHWIYMYYADLRMRSTYSPVGTEDGALDESTKKVVLEVPTQRETCCHTVWYDVG